MNHSNHGRRLLSAAAVVLGNAGYSLTVALFLEPAGLVAGGATGVALAFGRLTGLSVSGFLLAFNLVMLVWGWVVLGRAFALNTLASSILSPIFLGLAETMLHGRVLTDDLFLNTVFAAIGVGAFMGIVIRAGASTGGMDIPPLVLQKWFRWPVSATMLIFDIAVILIQIPFSPVPQLLYGIVAIIIQVMVMDKVLLWGESRTEVKLISTKADELCAAILHQLDRGVTILNGAGGYTHDPSAVLLSVISSFPAWKSWSTPSTRTASSSSARSQRCGAAASPWIKNISKHTAKIPRKFRGIFAYAYSKGAMALTSRPVRRSRVCPCQMLCLVASTVRHWVSVRWKSSSMAGMQGASTIQTASSKWW